MTEQGAVSPPGKETMPTIGGSVIQNARRVPGREALISGGRRWTWAALDDEVARAAGRPAARQGRPVRRPHCLFRVEPSQYSRES